MKNSRIAGCITNQMHADQAVDNIDSLATWRVIWSVVGDVHKKKRNVALNYWPE